MMMHNITPSVDYNQGLKRLDTELNIPTKQNSINDPKVVGQRIRYRYYKTLGTSVIKQPNVPSLPPGITLLQKTWN